MGERDEYKKKTVHIKKAQIAPGTKEPKPQPKWVCQFRVCIVFFLVLTFGDNSDIASNQVLTGSFVLCSGYRRLFVIS